MNESFEHDLFEQIPATSPGVEPHVHQRLALLASLFAIGTGGSFAVDENAADVTTSTPEFVVIDGDSETHSVSDVFVTPAVRLAIIRRWFSLTVTDLADVMRVKRPTVYAWMGSRSTPQPSNLARMRRLHNLARAWRRLAGRPLGNLRHESPDDQHSVLALLGSASLDDARLLATFNALATSVPAGRSKLSQMATDAGLPATPHDEPDRSFDNETLLT